MEEIGTLKEPLLGYTQQIIKVPIEKLKIIEVQRKPSAFHVRRLAESIKKIGFTTPLIAVKKDDEFVVIDGQQRLLAAKELGISELPSIVIPEKYALNLMELNIEKQMSLREKAHVALNVYRTYYNEDPSMREDDPKILDSIEFPHYVTLGIGYEKNPKLFGSAYEPILKRLDGFLALPLEDAMRKRGERADLVLEADDIARKAVERVKEIGITHPFVYREVVDYCNPIKRKREIEESIEEVLGKLKENLQDLVARPEKIRQVY